jgi:hypothetical protein
MSRRRSQAVGRTGARFPVQDAPDDTAVARPAPAPEEQPADLLDERIGRTGARFNCSARRVRGKALGDDASGEAASAGSDECEVAQPAPPRRDPDGPPTLPTSDVAALVPVEQGTRVRPYVRTRGRTRTRAPLAVETLVSMPSPRRPLVDPEHIAVGGVCGEPRSVAEVSALLSVPLGVARVVVEDMAVDGLLVVHHSVPGAPSMTVLHRVLDGLRRL